MIKSISDISLESNHLNLPAVQRIPECTPHSLAQLGRRKFSEILIKQSKRIIASKGTSYLSSIQKDYREFWEMYGESSDEIKTMTKETSNLNTFKERWDFFQSKYPYRLNLGPR